MISIDINKTEVDIIINSIYFKSIKLIDFFKRSPRTISGAKFYYRVIDFVPNIDLFLQLQAHGVPNYAIVELVLGEGSSYYANITYMNF